MAIAKLLVNSHGGDIAITSYTLKRTSIYFKWPSLIGEA